MADVGNGLPSSKRKVSDCGNGACKGGRALGSSSLNLESLPCWPRIGFCGWLISDEVGAIDSDIGPSEKGSG